MNTGSSGFSSSHRAMTNWKRPVPPPSLEFMNGGPGAGSSRAGYPPECYSQALNDAKHSQDRLPSLPLSLLPPQKFMNGTKSIMLFQSHSNFKTGHNRPHPLLKIPYKRRGGQIHLIPQSYVSPGLTGSNTRDLCKGSLLWSLSGFVLICVDFSGNWRLSCLCAQLSSAITLPSAFN